MEHRKRLNSSSGEKRTSETEKKIASKCNISGEQKAKEESLNYGLNRFPSKGKLLKQSMIPIVRCEKNTCEKNTFNLNNQKYFPSSSRCSSTSLMSGKRNEDLNKKLKLLEEKEKSIAEYYFRIENMIRSFVLQKENDRSLKHKTSQYSAARKMTSDPLVLSKTKITEDILSDFESNVQQISDIWLKTCNNLSNTLKNLKNNPSLDPKEFEVEDARIQLAIKRAKSFTLVKTRNVIAEAKKLFYDQEIIRRELENLLNHEDLKSKSEKCFEEKIKKNVQEKKPVTDIECIEKPKFGGTGDSYKEMNVINSENRREVTGTEDSEKEKETLKIHLNKLINEKDFFSEIEKSSSDETLKEQSESDESRDFPPKTFKEVEIWMKELAKKNNTITNLNNKIFELQKACNDHSLKYNQMQFKLAEFHEKIQWNQVLWKQIKKLKEQIKSLQQSNKQLESQKKELESKIIKLDQELDRLIKINHLLNQKKYLLKPQDFMVMEYKKLEKDCTKNRKGEELSKMMSEKCQREIENEFCVDERILAEKQNAINQLKTILNAMIDQENFAHQQISVFQSKIEELEKNTKA